MARLESREANGRFEAVVEALDQGVMVVRCDGHFALINAAAMQIYGLGPEAGPAEFAGRAAAAAVYDADGNSVAPTASGDASHGRGC